MSTTLEGEHSAIIKGDRIEIPEALRDLWDLQDGDVLTFWQHPLTGMICLRPIDP